MKEIFERRSIRKYLDKAVPKDMVEKIIMAGMAAPSSGNQQPWQFVIINEKELLYKIAEINPYAGMLNHCGVAVAVCGDISLTKYEEFWPQDCSAATQNMLLEAVHLGLGAVWLGIYPTRDVVDGIKKILNLPEGIIPFSIVPLGFPAENPGPANRYNQSRIHFNANQWQ